jgi:hypothetical protein
MTAQILKFPGKEIAIRSEGLFDTGAHNADLHMIDLFCGYADQLAVSIYKGPLQPADRARLMRLMAILQDQPVQ